VIAVIRSLLGPLVAVVCTAGGASVRMPEPAHDPASVSPAAAVATPASTEAEPIATDPTATPGDSAVAVDEGCPGEQETVNGYLDDDGCADELPPELAAITGIVEGITFEIDKDILRLDTSRATLDRLVDALARHPQVRVEIQVHEAYKPNHYGRCLTCRRATAIADYLVEHGIEPARVMSQGYGGERPLASNDTSEGRRQNRRVEVLLLGVDGRPVMDDRR
jgi:outer membrane protein OmpA-like peptidoglycan-associated protein